MILKSKKRWQDIFGTATISKLTKKYTATNNNPLHISLMCQRSTVYKNTAINNLPPYWCGS